MASEPRTGFEPVPTTITEQNFDSLVGSAHRFNYERFKDTLKPHDPTKPEQAGEVGSHWGVAYCLDREDVTFADVTSAADFLRENGHAYELASETAENSTAWWLLTDFKSRLWLRATEKNGKEQSGGE